MSSFTDPAALRAAAAEGTFRSPTVDECPGHVQANLLVLPRREAAAFRAVQRANPHVFPLIEEVSDPRDVRVAPNCDLRSAVPRYEVYRGGRRVDTPESVHGWWTDDLVGFLLGCSFSANGMLHEAGVLTPQDLDHHNPVYVTNRFLADAGPLGAPVVASMRAVPDHLVTRAIETTARLPFAHGVPLHVGDPEELGIADLDACEWGVPYKDMTARTPMFWACGVTAQLMVRDNLLPFAITHLAGHMFVTDLRVRELAV